jgi:hypothetical protein
MSASRRIRNQLTGNPNVRAQELETIHIPPTTPTLERIRRAAFFDRGDPHNSDPQHRKPQRLGTPWDRYCITDKNGNGTLEKHQIEAGRHYRDDYERAGYGRLPAAPLEPGVDGAAASEPVWVWEARSNITQAQRQLRAYEIDLLHAVLFHGRAAKEWARVNGRHYRSGLVYLKDTLDQIAPVWNLAPRRRV